MDREVRPQDDLFGYVNGGWVARPQIPSDRVLHGTFRILADDAEQHLRAIVEEAAAADARPGAGAGPHQLTATSLLTGGAGGRPAGDEQPHRRERRVAPTELTH